MRNYLKHYKILNENTGAQYLVVGEKNAQVKDKKSMLSKKRASVRFQSVSAKVGNSIFI